MIEATNPRFVLAQDRCLWFWSEPFLILPQAANPK
jgi:hypothetical protein